MLDLRRIHLSMMPSFSKFISGGILLIGISQAWGQGTSVDYQIGLTLYKEGSYAQAVSHFQSAIQTDPTFWQAYQVLGQCKYQLGDKTGALDSFNHSLQIHPNNPSLRNFVDKLRKIISQSPMGTEGSKPVSTLGMSARPLVNTASRMDPAFVQIYGTIGNSAFTDLNSGYRALNNLTSGTNSDNQTYFPYAGMGVEMGYSVDRNDCFSMNLELASVYGFSINSGDTQDEHLVKLNNQLLVFGLNYSYLTPDKDGPWIARFGVAYYLLGFSYSESEVDPATAVSQSVNLPAGSGNTLGASVALGKDFDIGGLSLEMLGKVKIATISQMTGAYTSTGGPNPGLNANGTGALAISSDGILNLVDQSQMGSSGERYALMELMGFELRVGLNYRF